MADIRALADTHRKTDTHNRLAAELGRDAAFDFGSTRLVRNVANEALELQSRVNHIFRIRDRLDLSGAVKTDLAAILQRLEYAAATARDVLEQAEANSSHYSIAAE